MEVLFALGLGLLALLLINQQQSGPAATTPETPPANGNAPSGDSPPENGSGGFWSWLRSNLFRGIEELKADYMADLRSRGWTGSSLSGNDADSVYAAYLAEIDKLNQARTDKDRERIRGEFEADLRKKGIFTSVTGSTPAEMYQSYLAGHVEYVRNHYIADLRRHGWAGTTLSGSSVDQIYEAYKAAYNQLVAQQRAQDLDRIRAFYVGDLQRRGWSGQTIQGNTPEVIYQNYLREYNSLLAVKYGLVTPLGATQEPAPTTPGPQPNQPITLLPKFKIGDRVRTTTGRVGVVAWHQFNANGMYFEYRLEEYPYTWYQESLLTLAPTGALSGGGGNVAV